MKLYQRIILQPIFPLISIIIVVLFFQKIWLTFILLATWSIIALKFWKSKETTIIFIFSGIIGTVLEIIAIRYGVWSYTANNFLGVPVWLFIL